ncbi:class II aldolase/adducin family protein [Plantactinospora sp. WMMC1484]|uniref:class II aldolase/adducin family protein n=1 Tax=Plantactinospora sp. WMMC1484 TaxID=3404122 RepID=UPI003BF47224
MNYLRGDLRDQLAYVGQDVVRTGLVVGSGGNLSARLPDGDSCWVTAKGTWLDRLDRTSFVRVRISDGSVLPDPPSRSDDPPRPAGATTATGGQGTEGGSGAARGPAEPGLSDGQGRTVQDGETLLGDATLPAPRFGPGTETATGRAMGGTLPTLPTSEVELHLAAYRARPDARAIVHLHPQTVLLLDALGEQIRLVTTDHGFYLRRVTRVPFRLPGTTELAELAAEATRNGTNCLVLSRHGCSVLGESVELAHKRAANLEEAARLTYRALAAGRLTELPELPAEFVDWLAGGATGV